MDFSYYKKMEPFWGVWYIDDELGQGSFGRVFKIKREDFGVTYYSALKIISMPNDKNEIDSLKSEGLDEQSISRYYESFAAELVKEFSLMAMIKGDSNIVSYEDHMAIKHEDGIGYDILIRMELLTPLTKYVLKETMDDKAVLRLGISICNALEVCGKFNIIHRDIKPENVFVSPLGYFKLGDFGVARVASQTTQGMSVKGTISYMAPEVYKGQEYNATVDLYSLGIMLYRLSNNNRGPFLPPVPQPINYADRDNAERQRMSGAELPDAANASPELMRIIRKAAAYDYKDRYRTAEEMREDLKMLMEGKTIKQAETIKVKFSFQESESETVSLVNKASVVKPSINEESICEAEPSIEKEPLTEDEKTVSVISNSDIEYEDTDATFGLQKIISETAKEETDTVTITEEENSKNDLPVEDATEKNDTAEIPEKEEPAKDYKELVVEKIPEETYDANVSKESVTEETVSSEITEVKTEDEEVTSPVGLHDKAATWLSKIIKKAFWKEKRFYLGIAAVVVVCFALWGLLSKDRNGSTWVIETAESNSLYSVENDVLTVSDKAWELEKYSFVNYLNKNNIETVQKDSNSLDIVLNEDGDTVNLLFSREIDGHNHLLYAKYYNVSEKPEYVLAKINDKYPDVQADTGIYRLYKDGKASDRYEVIHGLKGIKQYVYNGQITEDFIKQIDLGED